MSPTTHKVLLPSIGVYLQEVGPDSQEALWLAAAARVAREMPLAMTPFTLLMDDDDAFYRAIEDVARELAGPAMRDAEDQLDRCLTILNRSARPADLPAPCDSANELYTPKIDAAYFIGLAVGVRLGRVLEGIGAGRPEQTEAVQKGSA